MLGETIELLTVSAKVQVSILVHSVIWYTCLILDLPSDMSVSGVA